MVTLLTATSSVVATAQQFSIVKNARVDIMDGNYRRGELIYDVYVLDADRMEDNTYDFRGAEQARIRVDLRVEARNDKWGERMRVGISSRAFAQHQPVFWKAVGPRDVILDTASPVHRLTFEATREGTSNYFLPFTFLDTEEENWQQSSDWYLSTATKNRIAVPRITVRGLGTKPEFDWDAITANTGSLIAFVNNPESDTDMVTEGRSLLAKRISNDVKRLIYGDRGKAGVEEFVDLYEKHVGKGIDAIDDNVAMSKRHLATLTVDPKPEPNPKPKPGPAPNYRTGIAAINLALQQGDTAEARRVIEQFGDLHPEEVLPLRDSLVCWLPATYRVLDRSGEKERIELVNFLAPAYYDVFAGRLAIDDSLLAKQKLLEVVVLRSEPMALEVVDKQCPTKSVLISLENLMSAEMIGDTLNGVYHIRFRGGKKPYGLQLVATDGSDRSWSRKGIQENEVILTRDSLQAAGLAGPWRAEAFSTGSDSPVPVSGREIVIPAKPTPAWILPALTVLALGGVALLLLYIIRRGGSRHPTIFDEG
ncbi:hypothetical protein [Neolewinella xylanilytica]|nr:hypothetical protein [Neolewinella xylanilytica]